MFLRCFPAARRSAVRSRRRQSQQSARCRRLRLEALEDRRLLAANIWTDHLDYAPGATAQITGSGFAPGEPVQLQVLHTDQVPNTGSGHTPWIVTDGGSGDLDGRMDGSLQTTWYVNPDDSLGASFQLTASGLNSGEVATTAFTDTAYTITTDALWSSLSPAPTSGDTVVIAGGKTLTVDLPTATIGSIVLGNSTTGVGTLRFNAGSALTVSSSVTIGSTTLSTGRVDMTSGGTLKVGGALTNPYGSLTAGTGTVEYNGGGAQTAAALTYNHLVHSGAGTLTLNSASPLTVTGTFTNSAGTFDINGNTASLGSLSLTGGAVVDTATTKGSISATSAYAVQSGTISAILGGVASLTKTTSGTAILSGANTYTGATTIGAGLLNIQQATALGTTAAGTAVAAGAALQLQGGITVGAEALTLNGTGVANDGALRSISGANTFGGLITLGSAARINSDASTLTISNTGTITGATFALTVGGSGATRITSIIGTGTGALTKDGSGTLTLSRANTYGGDTLISLGTLKLGAGNVLPDGAGRGNVTVTGTLDLAGFSDTINGLSGAGTVDNTTATAATLTVGSNNAISTFSGLITSTTGTVALVKTGTGTLTLSGANTYTGTTTVSTGVLLIQHATALGTAAGGTTVASGAALQLSGGITVGAERLTLNGTGVSNSGALRSISGANTFGGLITLGRAARINSDADSLTISHAGTITGSGLSLSIGGSGNSNISSIIGTGAGGLTKDGNGMLMLYGASTFTGTVSVNAGTLKYGAANAMTAGNRVVINAGGTFDLNNFSDTIGALTLSSGSSAGAAVSTGAGTLTLGGNVTSNASGTGAVGTTISGNLALGATRIITVNSGSATSTLTISAVVSGGYGITKQGAGTLALSGTNTYTGTTTISTGVLDVANSAALGGVASGTTVAGGAAMQLQGNITVGAEALTLNGTGVSNGGALRNISGANTFGGLIILGSTARINSDSGSSLTISNAGTITGATFGLTVGGSGTTSISSILGTTSGTLTKDGSGTLALSGANTYTGATTISAGVVNIRHATALGTTAGGTTVTSGAALELQNGITVGAEALTLSGTGVAASGALRNISGTNTFGGLITLGTAARINSDSGSSLTISNAGTIAGSGFNLTVGGAGATSIASIIGIGAGTLTKDGSGTLTLSGANTYPGTTTINEGTLLVNGSGQIGVTALAGGTLSGNGTVGAITMTTTGTVSPGSGTGSTGILHSGNVAWTSGATFAVDVNGATAGTQYDQLQVTGTVALNSATLTLSRAANDVSIGTSALILIDNVGSDAIDGTFLGLPEGAPVTVPGDAFPRFTISYAGGSGNNDVVLNELLPAGVYVDDSWGGTPVGTMPASSYPEGLVFGYNAFATVQAALTQVAVAGTVTVYGGAYSGTVNIATALTEIVAATNPYVPEESTVQVDGEVTLGASTAFRETGATNLVFANAIHGTTAGNQALTITGDNTLTFQGPVGTVDVPLAGLTTSAGLGLALDGGGVQTTGQQAYGGAVSLGADASLATSTGDITFGSTVDSTANQAYSLSLNAGTGDILFTGAVGSGTDQELDHLTIAGAADVMFSAGVRTTGNLTQTAGIGTTSLHGGTVGDSLSLTTQRLALDSGSLTVANRTTFQTSNAHSTAVSQAAGTALLTKDLLLLGDGTFTLDQPLNHVTGNLAANVLGSLTYRDAGSLQIGTVEATSGLTTGNVTLGGGAVTLHAGGVLTVNAVVSSTTGDLVLTGGTGVEHNASGDLTTTDVGTISVTATANDVTMADGTVYRTGSGTVAVRAAGNVKLGAITTTSSAIGVTATAGAITDITAEDTTANLTGGTVTLTAATGIGSAGGASDIDTAIETLVATNNTSGNIDIDETDAVTVSQAEQATAGNIQIIAGGTLTVSNGVAASNAVIAVGAGTITLKTNAAGSAIAVNSGVNSAAGAILIEAFESAGAGENLTVAPNVTVQSTGSTITLNVADNLIISSGATVSASGTLTVNADLGDIDVGTGTTVVVSGTITGSTVTFNSGADNDTFNIVGSGTGTLIVNAGAGNDYVAVALVTTPRACEFYGGAGNDFLSGAAGDDALHGGTGNNTIYGYGGVDTIDVIDSRDRNFIDGGAGNDTITGDVGPDTIHGGAGNDFVRGGAGNDILYADSGNDILLGGNGNDILFGGSGGSGSGSLLTGGAGSDRLYAQHGDLLISGNALYGVAPATDDALLDILTAWNVGHNETQRGLIKAGSIGGHTYGPLSTSENPTVYDYLYGSSLTDWFFGAAEDRVSGKAGADMLN